MEIIKSIEEIRKISRETKSKNRSVGFVPTMGALHQGHLNLITESVKDNNITILSIFVNPKQFAPNEDFDAYPRNYQRDLDLAKDQLVDYVFMPNIKDIYPIGYKTRIVVNELSSIIEGKYRPHFFEGVATVCTKLFLATEPSRTYFGQKDYQQCLIIKRLIKDLNLPIEFIMVPIAREPNGLAMSSRNQYLTETDKEKSSIIFLALEEAKKAIASGELKRKSINAFMHKSLRSVPEIKLDYAVCCLAEDLSEPEIFLKGDKIVLLIACYLGKTRLIDNSLMKI